jgi:tetratricopeptide (TPR) repeat protein
MIVRDEAAVIERCLASCRDLIDRWVICDTGSVDDTPARIERALAGVPGELHHHEWVDFGHNRTEVLRLARGRADHLLLLDADWTVEVAPGALEDLTADSYMVRHAGAVEFHNKRIVAGRLDWRYVGATHEYITCPDERTCERLDAVTIHVHAVGGSQGRWERDLELLARQPDDPRSAFYYAQTLRDLGRTEEARAAYERRATMGGWEEEVYCALHEAGTLAGWPDAVDLLTAAWERRPQRLEAVYDLSVALRLHDRHHAAHRFTSLAAGLAELPVPADDLHVAPWVYRWGLLFEYAITAYWIGDHVASIAACDALLARDDLPPEYRAQTARNRRYAIEARAARIAATAPRT